MLSLSGIELFISASKLLCIVIFGLASNVLTKITVTAMFEPITHIDYCKLCIIVKIRPNLAEQVYCENQLLKSKAQGQQFKLFFNLEVYTHRPQIFHLFIYLLRTYGLFQPLVIILYYL